MAPNSRIILVRHAQAEHNVDLDYSIPDAPLTPLGKRQAATLAHKIPSSIQSGAALLCASPLRRTLQTTLLGFGGAMARLGGPRAVVLLPQAQECNDLPCDTGSPRTRLAADPEFACFDLSEETLPDDWTSKRGFWAATDDALDARAAWVRRFLRDRPEEGDIVLVAHGDILRRITGRPGDDDDDDGPEGGKKAKAKASTYMWRNAEARIFEFDDKYKDTEEAWLFQREDVAVAGGYGPTSTELDLEEDLKSDGRS
ncbi:phosphoglycerate mutase-like protein [Xylariomycetidae sp. FL2044]|nr:phosphoglycerate mutase-like protein [Xylariomycetidae sp. FL2044]